MKRVKYKIIIKGLRVPKGTIPMKALKDISELFLEGSERSLRLAIEGESIKKGKMPTWLSKSLEFVITGIGSGSTILEIEAPTLGESAPEQVQQQELWYAPPDPQNTAVSLFSRSSQDATSEQLESEHYDIGVLDSLLSFKSIFQNYANELEVDSQQRLDERFKLGREELEKVQRLKMETPEPMAVVVAGLFNTIEHSKRRFQLILKDQQSIPGAVDPSFVDVEQMRSLWGKKVTIKGIVQFKPSGKVRILEAQVIKPFEAGEEVFETLPESQPPSELVSFLKKKKIARSPLMDVWGQWPGEESIDEILAALRKTLPEG